MKQNHRFNFSNTSYPCQFLVNLSSVITWYHCERMTKLVNIKGLSGKKKNGRLVSKLWVPSASTTKKSKTNGNFNSMCWENITWLCHTFPLSFINSEWQLTFWSAIYKLNFLTYKGENKSIMYIFHLPVTLFRLRSIIWYLEKGLILWKIIAIYYRQ